MKGPNDSMGIQAQETENQRGNREHVRDVNSRVGQ